MTVDEATLALHNLIAEVLVDLALEGDEDADTIDDLEASMQDLSEMLIDTLGLTILSVDDRGWAVAEMNVKPLGQGEGEDPIDDGDVELGGEA